MVEVVMLLVGGASLLASILLLIRYLPQLRRAAKEELEASELLKAFLEEVKSRMNPLAQRLADHQARIDLLDLRLRRLEGGREGEAPKVMGEVAGIKESLEDVAKGVTKGAMMQRKEEPQVMTSQSEEGLTETERAVLRLLQEGPKTPSTIRAHIRKSREHTARILKSLYERGLVERDEGSRPFVYRLKARPSA